MERIAHLTQNYSAVLEKITEITSRLDLKIKSSLLVQKDKTVNVTQESVTRTNN